MPDIYFITHPDVIVDKNIPVTQWDLSEQGRQRLEMLLQQPWISSIGTIYSSNELKAKKAAEAIAERTEAELLFKETLGETDRSSTGYLEDNEFKQQYTEFFTAPTQSLHGWEKAQDAQDRIVKAIQEIILDNPSDNTAIVSHGRVGALLLSHLKEAPISTAETQPGQGHYFVIDKDKWILKQDWQPIDELSEV